MKVRFFFLILALMSTAVSAVEVPKPTPYDERIVEVDYFENQVYRLSVFYGMHMHIVLNTDEVIRKEWIKFGDPKAWDTEVIGNHVFIKFIDRKPETNMTILTSKRSYEFVIEGKTAASIDDKGGQLRLAFNYPVDDFRRQQEAERKGLDAAIAQQVEATKPYNYRYDWQGSGQLKPLEVKDDGERTYFKFAPQKELPDIYAVGPDGTELPTNFSVVDGYYVVQRVAARFAIRYGDLLTCIRNRGFGGITALSDKEAGKAL